VDAYANVLPMLPASSLIDSFYSGNLFVRAGNYLYTQWLDVQDPLMVSWFTRPSTNNKLMLVGGVAAASIPPGNYSVVIYNNFQTDSSKKLLVLTVNSIGTNNYVLGFSLLACCKQSSVTQPFYCSFSSYASASARRARPTSDSSSITNCIYMLQLNSFSIYIRLYSGNLPIAASSFSTAFSLGRYSRSRGRKMCREPPVAGTSGSSSRQVLMIFQGLSLFQSKSLMGPLRRLIATSFQSG